jgi:hypothetical protein
MQLHSHTHTMRKQPIDVQGVRERRLHLRKEARAKANRPKLDERNMGAWGREYKMFLESRFMGLIGKENGPREIEGAVPAAC